MKGVGYPEVSSKANLEADWLILERIRKGPMKRGANLREGTRSLIFQVEIHTLSPGCNSGELRRLRSAKRLCLAACAPYILSSNRTTFCWNERKLPLSQYALHFRTLAAKLSLNNDDLVATFWQGLCRRIKDKLAGRSIASGLDTLITLCNQIDIHFQE